jgi:amidase
MREPDMTKQSQSDSLLHYGTAKELAEALAAKTFSALELTDHIIARIEALDKPINAVIVHDFDRAREAAKNADAAIARGDKGPLLGIPITVKESFDIAGLPTTWGVPLLKGFVAQEDALMVVRAKKAGAIVLGKTNVPFLLGDWQSYNDIYGTTNNPWNIKRSPGGSSGGSSAALAAGFGPLSLGTDIGGSLRIPAHFCGVYAHKPTLNLAPSRGHKLPGLTQRVSDLAVVGPMARSADDLDLLLNVTAGPDEVRDGIAYRLSLPPPRHQTLKDFRVLIVDEHPLVPLASDMRAAIDNLAQRLGKAGAKVARQSPLLPDLAASARLYMRLLLAALSERWQQDVYEQTLAMAAALKPDDNSLYAERLRGVALTHREWAAADIARIELGQRWATLFREYDVVIAPSFSTPAFLQDQSPSASRQLDVDGEKHPYMDQLVWADFATTPGLPATSAPIGLSDTGLPIGVQIIGPYLEDRTPIAFATLIEREFGGFVPPPGY